MPAAVEVHGAKELRAAIRHAGDEGLKAELKRTNKSAAEVVAEKALPNVPVRSGRLKATVRALGSQKAGRALAGSAGVPYAAAIHWGRKTRGVIQGRPFLWDAAQEHKAEVVAEYERGMERLFDQIHTRG